MNSASLAALYLLLAVFSYGVASDAQGIALVWLPSSVAVVWVMASRRSQRLYLYGVVFLANVIVAWLYGSGLPCSLGCSVAKLAGIMVAVGLLGPFYGRVLTVRDSAYIFSGYLLLAAPVSAAIGATLVWLANPVEWSTAAMNWWLGETIGAVLLLLPSLAFFNMDQSNRLTSGVLTSVLVQLGGLFVISFIVLTFALHPFAYLALPLMAVALAYGMLRVAVLANLVFLVLGAGIAWGWWAFPLMNAQDDPRGIWAASAAVIFGPMILGLAMDEIRRRQTELTTLGERLNLASQSVDLALWDWDVKSGEIYWDNRMRQLYEIGPYDEPLAVPQWREKLHPDDVLHAETNLNDALAGKAEYKTQFRIQRNDGSYRSLQAAGIVIRDNSGAAVRMVGMNWDVSELVRAQRAVKTAEDKLNAVIEAASEFSIVATNQEGLIEVFSAGAERLLGYKREDIVGQQTPALFHDDAEVREEGERLTLKLGYEVEGFEVFVAQARQGVAVSREWTYLRKDGRRIPVNLTVTAIYDDLGEITGYLGVARNIIQQKIAEREIRAAHSVLEQQIKLAQQMRDEFESLFELAPGAMLVLDGEGCVVNANSRAHQMFATEHTMLGRSITLYLPDFNLYHQSISKPVKGSHSEQEWLANRADGERFEALLEYGPLLLNGVVHTIVNVYDISEQKEAERALQRSRDLAESANRAKTEFLANMSHEIRTPLNAVLGASQLLGYTSLDKNQSNHVGMISAAGKALLTLLNDVLDVSKIEAGKMELSRAPFALDGVIEALATIMSGNAADKNLELIIDVAPEMPRGFIGDEMRFQQILVNLAGNAIKFTEQGEVVVQFALLSLEANQARIQIRVRDSGIGMDDGQRARLFSAFSQADTSITRRFGGTGLGLTICKKLIELMQGTIDVRSTPGVGSEFCCQLALEVDTSLEHDVPVAQPARRVLLADASPASASALVASCERLGWVCETVADVVQARQRLTRADTDFDVLVFNQNLPHAEQLTTLERGIPTVKLMGSMNHEALMRNNLTESRVVILSKPVTASTLLDGVNEACLRYSDRTVEPIKPEEKPLPRLDGARLLLVEDTVSNQVIIEGIFEQVGAQVDVAANGVEALDMLSECAGRSQYDAVLMDVQMPVMDGFTATRKIREELKLSLPIIAMTAGVLAFERQQCIDSGMNDFVGKPLDIPAMLETVCRYVSPRVAAPQQQVPAAATESNSKDFPQVVDGVFNPEKIMSFVRGKPAREKDIINMIERIVTEDLLPLEQGRQLLEDGRIEEAARHFHTLKGTMGNFGGDKVMQASQALEQAIKQQQEAEYEGLLQHFGEALQHMLTVARSWLQSYHTSAGPQTEVDNGLSMGRAAFRAALDDLKDKLNCSNMDAAEVFTGIAPEISRRVPADTMASLTEAIEELRFNEAAKLLEGL
ncbi:MAG: PAS domain S-box protein [Ketobacter sp.]|nr:PAS domain S-box protein [Ketobacter sp.]